MKGYNKGDNISEQFLNVMRLADFTVLMNSLAFDAGVFDAKLEGYPAWVIRSANKVTHALFPMIYEIEDARIKRAYYLGAAYGMMRGGELKLASALPAGLPEATEEQSKAAWKLLFGADSESFTPSPSGSLIPVEITSEIHRIEAELDLHELAEFHQGFADAIRMIAGENKSTETTQVYSFMVTYWRHVDKLPTAESLHTIIRQVHGANVAGADPKRIAQMCLRVGKTFRSPGRPRKTTSASK